MKIPLKQYLDVLSKYLKPQWQRVILLAVLLFSTIALQLINPQFIRYFIDTAQNGGETQTLIVAALLFIAVALVNQGLLVIVRYVSENVGWTATNMLRVDLVRHCLQLDLSFHKSRTPGELIERIDGDVSMLANFFSQFVIQVLGNLLLLIGVLAVLFSEDWRIGLTLTFFSLFVFLVLNRIRGIVVPYWQKARQASAEVYSFLEERLAGVVDIRSSNANAYVMRSLYGYMREFAHKQRKAAVIGEFTTNFLITMYAVSMGITFFMSYSLVIDGTMTVGTAYLILFYVGLLIQPIMVMSRQVQDLQRATVGIFRVQELLQYKSAIKDGNGVAPAANALSIAFQHVSFGYDAETRVLHDIFFQLQPRRVLGLLGHTGSGKTTLSRLLFRLYDPDEGQICLDGVDIRTMKLADLRQQIGVVTQDVQLFHCTVRENLTFFDVTIDDKRILSALNELGLMPWYNSLPEGLDTVLSSSNSRLSAGEAQLLAFTRVFLRDPKIIILDEASSRLDLATERLLEQAIDKLLKNRTGIIIAHRLATIKRVDDILILENGHICEYGAREQLMQNPSSRFSQLLQAGLEQVLV